MMAVLPQINAADSVVLNVRPTIRRQVAEALDPNPALREAGTENRIPVFETREFDSILRLQSGQTGVLAGLMQDIMDNTDSFIPGIRNIPILGDLLSNRNDLSRKTELVISGRYEDRLEKVGGKWLFTERKVRPDTRPAA